MKRIYRQLFILFCLAGIIQNTYSQSSTEVNSVERRISLTKETSEASFDTYSLNLRNSKITYFDGLGRSVQEVIRGGSPAQKDLVSATDYDANGRISRRYLSYRHISNDGKYKANYEEAQKEFYRTPGNHARDAYPFAETVYEASPLNRVVTQGAPGRDWQPLVSDFEIENFNTYINYGQYVVDPVSGGGGVSVSVLDKVLSVSFSAGFDNTTLKIGQVGFLHGGIPDMSLGSLQKGTYYAYIKDGYLCIGVYAYSEQITGLNVKFVKDLFEYGTVSVNPHTVKFAYHVNETNDKVKLWKAGLNSELPETSGDYLAGSLTKIISIDEASHQTQEYTDKRGHIILKRVQVHGAESTIELWADTYYIYDDIGNLRFVLPPEASQKLNSGTTLDEELLSDYAFTYKYDARGRIARKRVPGSDWVYMVYDKRDRIVLTQDGNQRDANITTGKEWTFTKYDQLNRPIATGIYTHTATVTQAEMQTVVNNFYDAAASNQDEWYEQMGTSVHGYTDLSFPKGVIESDYLTVTYYDNYAFKSLPDFGTDYDYDPTQLSQETNIQGIYTFPSAAFDRVKGQITGSKVKTLDGNNTWANSVTYYDNRYRVIQTITKNYSGSIDKQSMLYNFPGWVLAAKRSHTNGGNTYEMKKSYTYDHAGRLMQGYHEMIENGITQGKVLLAKNKYNELGELIEKNLHVENNVPQQSIDYRYNIRGWLENINSSTLQIEPEKNIDDANPDLFGMELLYNHPLNGVPAVN
ncbi:hypothetical protein JMN32_25225 [Fulvivirga sp. 29W222]|uniref:DUF6443 domain-containing protein n=1 Tax=Fulvivirga marina TaxID=2494733 RepID=A0A937G2U0_9BACT|nr:DUF6443 domain-containing protein [Fulvivirga marina]MBL6449637.1 hypothetical protein [Fulvivirga marina]